jgi:drug/metabolite transporter (DMT)-like permease
MLKKIPRSHLCALGTIGLWAFAYVGTRVAVRHFDALELGFLRNLVAALFFAGLARCRRLGLPPLRDWPLFFLSGFLGFALYLVFFNTGLETLNAATSCILISTVPLFTALFASLAYGEKLRPPAWLGMGVAFGGVCLLSLWDNALTIGSGVFWTLGAALCLSAFNIVQRSFSGMTKVAPGKADALPRRRYSSEQVTAYSFFAATLLSGLLAPSALRAFWQADLCRQGLVIFLGVFPSALAYLLWAKAMSCAVSTSSVANYMFLTPFLALLLGFLFLSEWPGPGALAGGALILGGLALYSLTMRR